MRYDKRFGYIQSPKKASPLGGFGMGSLGEDCAALMQNYQTYTRLSKKTDKKKDTRARAAQMAQDYMNRYQACVNASAVAKAQTAAPAPVAHPVVIPALIPSTSPVVEPIPYVPIDYGSGGGGGGSGGGTVIPEAVPSVSPENVIVQTGQSTATGQPIYYNQTTQQSFYYDANGLPVYYNPATGRWGLTTDMVQTVQPSQALTPVAYVQMPTDDGSQTAAQSGQVVDQYGQPVSQAAAAAYTPVQYVPMPDGSETQVAQLPAGTTSIGEVEFVGAGKAEYSDQWGTIRVIKLVIPKKATTTAPAAAAITGGQALPGGEMKVEDFTAQYAMEGGQW